MLRVGLTGQLGSGKSTVARMLAERGAHVFSADDIGRELMQPGQAVFSDIVKAFGAQVLRPDGTLDRALLAREAFANHRVEDLNAIVHPAVIAEQERRCAELALRQPNAVAVIESALIFEAERDARKRGDITTADWGRRFDRIVLVTADEETKLARVVARAGGPSLTEVQAKITRGDALQRMAAQIPDEEKLPYVDYVIRNDGTQEALGAQVDELWRKLFEQ